MMALTFPRWLAAGGLCALAGAMAFADPTKGGIGYAIGLGGAVCAGLGSVLMVSEAAQPRRHG